MMRRKPPVSSIVAEVASTSQGNRCRRHMSDTTAPQQPQVTGLSERPKRADARRNYEKLLTAAADAFAENGTATSLEDIARRADVGIGTLYRHFPTRQALLEAVYIDEVEEISRKAND